MNKKVNSIIEKLKTNSPLVADGAWGTMLQQKGLKIGECPELWNLTNRNKVFQIAKEYVNAGAEIIKTNSFGGNKFRLEHFNLQDKIYELNKAAAEISSEAAGENVFVFGSVGPTGKILMMEDISEQEIYDSFSLQVKALEDGGADVILIETFSAIDEALIAIKAARENTHLPIACSFTFEKNLDGSFRTMMGVDPEIFLNAVVNAGADIIGTNCGNGFENMVELVSILRSLNPYIPIIVNSNAGMPIIQDGKIIYPETPEFIKPLIEQMINAGANIIGGCCGTTPEHIKIIADICKNQNKKHSL